MAVTHGLIKRGSYNLVDSNCQSNGLQSIFKELEEEKKKRLVCEKTEL